MRDNKVITDNSKPTKAYANQAANTVNTVFQNLPNTNNIL